MMFIEKAMWTDLDNRNVFIFQPHHHQPQPHDDITSGFEAKVGVRGTSALATLSLLEISVSGGG